MSGNGFEIVRDQHPLQNCGFLEQRRVLQALHSRFLDDQIL
jgi:hypothetical protein